jgi:precorrin-8X/cobalt-precorrin-8 methylmutase
LNKLNHPILEQSFAIIDQEIGNHSFLPAEYAVIRRVIHATADFEFKELIRFNHEPIHQGIEAITQKKTIITDVNMVKQGIINLVNKTFKNNLISAIDFAPIATPGKTRTETGMLQCLAKYPDGIYLIGNAPTALLAICHQWENLPIKPSLIIGAPVGFVSVLESKEALAKLPIPQIIVEGRKGGSPVAAAIFNALLILASEVTVTD